MSVDMRGAMVGTCVLMANNVRHSKLILAILRSWMFCLGHVGWLGTVTPWRGMWLGQDWFCVPASSVTRRASRVATVLRFSDHGSSL